MKYYFSALILCFIGLAVSASESKIDGIKPLVKSPTQVMVLGTTHLRQVKQPLAFNALSPVVNKLKSFSPHAIAIEALRPIDVLAMQLQQDQYKNVLSQFVGDDFLILSSKINETLGTSSIAAMKQLKIALEENSFERIWHERIIGLATAAKDKQTALLHFAYIAHLKSSLSDELKDYYSDLFAKNSEIKLIAINLAMKLKLTTLQPIDDHLDKDQYMKIMPKLIPSFKKSTYINILKESEYSKKPAELSHMAVENGDWLALYNWVNSDKYQRQELNVEWRAFIDKDLEPAPAMSRIAMWEVRNLNMVSHIMRVVADNPGGKVLVVVGANHKVFFEDYLSSMIGVEIVDF